ncbi:EcsC family protein [Macrococcus capreoli]|uniref:EcsC family protein n=1 Tax=Macrococcus capreoli TaxID=2982690 RepID=UPI0021D5BE4A|nr:EcsC family protein [Macrococcus sp. TMW 2.2395]MCU7558582.1 EcsC family protein [Macrococcus sp. TMW 2.2395]
MKELTESNVGKVLEWTYDKAENGVPGNQSAEELANSYLKRAKNEEEAIKSLIKWQTAKCTTSGVVTGIGGGFVAAVGIPANLASVMYMQMRMIAAIAHIRGYDLRDDQVQTFVYVCLTGQSINEVLKSSGIKIGRLYNKQEFKFEILFIFLLSRWISKLSINYDIINQKEEYYGIYSNCSWYHYMQFTHFFIREAYSQISKNENKITNIIYDYYVDSVTASTNDINL